MRVIGIDPGTGIVGFGIIDVKNVHERTLIDAGVITTPVNTPLPERLVTIHENIVELLDEYKPGAMVIEQLFFAQNVTTAMGVAHARGVIIMEAQKRGLEIVERTPLQIKQTLTGYGKAHKKQMQEMVKIILKLKEIPKPDDCADALAAALCYIPV
jgi:crossover junction endodeoxyribonuclease RuvC